VNKEGAEQSEREASSKIIADLTRSIEELVSGRKKPQQLKGVLAEAGVLVQEWEIKEPSGRRRPLFDDTISPLSLLLAGLVVTLRRDHQLVEQICRHFPHVLDRLSCNASYADGVELAIAWASTQPKPKSWQKYEFNRRRKWNRSFTNSIEYQFGGELQDNFSGRCLFFSADDPLLKPMVSSKPICLDDIFAGEFVGMPRLEELFWMERHLLSKALQGVQARRYNYVGVLKIMDFLLAQKGGKRRKRNGAPPRSPWLSERDCRTRVLTGIEAWVNSVSVAEHVKNAFLAVLHRHLPNRGNK
jgi:hypothetical protein